MIDPLAVTNFASSKTALAIARIVALVISLGLWFWTQWLLSRRKSFNTPEVEGALIDGIHLLTARTNRRLNANPRAANGLLISSSLVIDLLGFFLLGASIFGPTIEPFLGIFMLFALRQICQLFCPLPTPPGMIWRKTGFPTILVTYGTSNDLFFSGHTAIAVFGCATLAHMLGPVGIALGIAIAAFEIGVVLVLRAHYTMDVFAGAATAMYIHRLAMDLAPAVDRWIAHGLAMM